MRSISLLSILLGLVWLVDLFDIMSSAWLEMMHCETVVELIKVVHYATTFPEQELLLLFL